MSVFTLLLLLSAALVTGLIPKTPTEQTRRAIASLRDAIEGGRRETVEDDDVGTTVKHPPRRFFVDYLIPLPPETNDADIDPWPGGLAQMYPYAEEILTAILKGVVDEPTENCKSQVISQSDCCGLFIQESSVSPKNDVAAILFPGVDQLDKIAEIDSMVGEDRTLIIFNRQFQRPQDFGFFQKSKSEKQIFNKFTWGFAFQELACRGEDVKLTYEYPNWKSCVVCDEDVDVGRKEINLLSPQPDRPLYDDLEKKINDVLPQPLWMRKMGEAEKKGFKFQR